MNERYVTDRQTNATKRRIAAGEIYKAVCVEWVADHYGFRLKETYCLIFVPSDIEL